MAIFKCKMCGGNVNFTDGATVGVCDSCGTKQTLPRLDDDRRANLYDRANHFRRNNEFDKAAGIYEQILNEDPTDAEAYWSLVLCQYGIEYVEDPATRKRVPTVNRAQFTSIFDDDNYKSALQYADADQRGIYEAEANAINEIQKGILAISQKEEPFDVFICYKETDNNGRRTPDSVLANDLYHQLTQEGFKVFFARITLEDKLGTAYEPYIFAALNSAKVMVVLGTKPEYFNAVWVKNEWSRYLALVKKSGGKKVLIPAYKDMDPYDLPEEFSHLQAQDMSKLGFMQDLIRGIKKLVNATGAAPAAVRETVVASGFNPNVAPLLERVYLFLEDGKWQDANIYCEKVLDIDPKNAEAYLGKLMADLHVKTRKQLAYCAEPFDDEDNYKKVLRFGDEKLEVEMRGYITKINERNKNTRFDSIYSRASVAMKTASTEPEYRFVAMTFQSISGFKDADELAKQCRDKAEAIKRNVQSIVAALKTGVSGKKTPTLEEKLAAAKTRVGYLERIQNLFGEIMKQVEIVQDDLNGIVLQEKQLSEQRSRLGVFSGKEKKIIDEKLAILVRKKSDLKKQIDQFSKKLGGYTDLASVEKDLEDSRKNVIELEFQVKCTCESKAFEYSFEEAFSIYQNSPDITEAVNKVYPAARFILVMQGKANTIKFGTYNQCNKRIVKNGTLINAKEDIEWLVLTMDEKKAFVISKYALDCQAFNTPFRNATWETCSLRKWLNGSFINAAFSGDEQKSIISSVVTADNSFPNNTSFANGMTDRVFLLSVAEVNTYLGSNAFRRCQGTAYCHAQGAYKSNNDDFCWWWLRSSGRDSSLAASVNNDGSVNRVGFYVDYRHNAVRPAMWISLEP